MAAPTSMADLQARRAHRAWNHYGSATVTAPNMALDLWTNVPGTGGVALSFTSAGNPLGFLRQPVGEPGILLGQPTINVVTADTIHILIDRLVHNGGFVMNSGSVQGMTTPALPSRGGSGHGVLAAITFWAATSNATATTITVDYTNSNGTPGRTGTARVPGNTNRINWLIPIELQEGDIGVQSIQSITVNTPHVAAGNIGVVLYRTLGIFPGTRTRAAGRNSGRVGRGPYPEEDFILTPWDPDTCFAWFTINVSTTGIAHQLGVLQLI